MKDLFIRLDRAGGIAAALLLFFLPLLLWFLPLQALSEAYPEPAPAGWLRLLGAIGILGWFGVGLLVLWKLSPLLLRLGFGHDVMNSRDWKHPQMRFSQLIQHTHNSAWFRISAIFGGFLEVYAAWHFLFEHLFGQR